MPGAGASSITFWWRRCSEQSRSLRWIALPCASANTWISMWRGAATYFSISTRASPNAPVASRCAPSSAASNSACLSTRAHALAAAAGDRLDQHRIADLVGLLLEERPAPAARRDSRARPARRPSPSAPWRDPSAPWRGSPPAAGRRRRCRPSAQASAKPAFSDRKP